MVTEPRITQLYSSMSATAQARVSGGEPVTTLTGRDPLPAKWIEVSYAPDYGAYLVEIGVERDPRKHCVIRRRGADQLDSLPQWARDFADRHNPFAVTSDD